MSRADRVTFFDDHDRALFWLALWRTPEPEATIAVVDGGLMILSPT